MKGQTKTIEVEYTLQDRLRDEFCMHGDYFSFRQVAELAGTTTAILRRILAGESELMTPELGHSIMTVFGGPDIIPSEYPSKIEIDEELYKEGMPYSWVPPSEEDLDKREAREREEYIETLQRTILDRWAEKKRAGYTGMPVGIVLDEDSNRYRINWS